MTRTGRLDTGGRDVIGRRVGAGHATAGECPNPGVTALAPTPTGARRADRRIRTRLRDGIVAPGRGLINVVIRDRSGAGARLQLNEDVRLPPVFLLTDTALRARFRARLMWQAGRDAGVKLAPV